MCEKKLFDKKCQIYMQKSPIYTPKSPIYTPDFGDSWYLRNEFGGWSR